MKKQFFNSDLFLNIVRFGIVLSIICFTVVGCMPNPWTPQEIISAYGGTWEFNSTYYHEDSIFVHKAWLTINKDSTFTCSASFFLREDSLRSQPMSGKWSYGTVPTDVNQSPDNKLTFSSEAFQNSWIIRGTAQDGFMNWGYKDWSQGSVTLYGWKFQKAE